MIRLPDDLNPYALADWLEVSLLFHLDDPHRISDAEIIKAIEDRGGDPDLDLANLSAEIDRRHRIMPALHPVQRDGLGFTTTLRWQATLHYSFLLLLSLNQHYQDLVYAKGATGPAQMFEVLVGVALGNYANGPVVRMGAKRLDPVPGGFPAAVKHLSGEMREECTYGRIRVHYGGDDGLDLAVWRPHVDQRPSQLIIFTQCSIGTDWSAKRSDLSLDLWREHISWHTPPLKAFAVPFVHPEGADWRETAVTAGMILDRPRIVSLLQPTPVPDKLNEDLLKWSERRARQVERLSLN